MKKGADDPNDKMKRHYGMLREDLLFATLLLGIAAIFLVIVINLLAIALGALP